MIPPPPPRPSSTNPFNLTSLYIFCVNINLFFQMMSNQNFHTIQGDMKPLTAHRPRNLLSLGVQGCPQADPFCLSVSIPCLGLLIVINNFFKWAKVKFSHNPVRHSASYSLTGLTIHLASVYKGTHKLTSEEIILPYVSLSVSIPCLGLQTVINHFSTELK